MNLKNSIAELNELVSTTNTSYYENLGKKLNDLTMQTKSSWTFLKPFHNNKKIPLIPPLLIGDKFVTDIKTQANIYNKFFAEQCTPLKTYSVLPTSQNLLAQCKLQSIDFSCEEISKIIRPLDLNKVHDHDDISIRMIKICDNSLVRPLATVPYFQ